MEEGSLSLAPQSSSASAPEDVSQGKQEAHPDVEPGTAAAGSENVSLITESMTVTSTDQEKLLLLNKNTELRRVNKELMKLNEDWDQVYRSATLSLQQRVETLTEENSAVKQLNSRLLLKVEHEQSAREYYEQTLTQELKRNQDLQKSISELESRRQQKHGGRGNQGNLKDFIHSPASCKSSHSPGRPIPAYGHSLGVQPTDGILSGPEAGQGGRGFVRDSQQEVQDLKDHMEALRCQTQIYEADYKTEHKDHKHTQHENRRLRKNKDEMRQQVALLREQLKVYEDDFKKERSDKQLLQRMLNKTHEDPVLVHHCNNTQRPPGGDKRPQSGEATPLYHPLCPNHFTNVNEDFHRTQRKNI